MKTEVLEIRRSFIEPASLINNLRERRQVVEHMATIVRFMGGPFATAGLSPQQVDTPLAVLPIDDNVLRRLGNRGIYTVADFLGKTEKDLVMPTYWFSESSFAHVLFVLARAEIYPQVPQPQEKSRPLLAAVSHLRGR
jgi:hypothetical protein